MRLVSCRRCGKPSRTTPCGDCAKRFYYGTAEYRRNSQLIRNEVKRRLANGIPVYCVICCGLMNASDITVEHIIPLAQGGSNALSNLGPACSSCNYSHHSAR